MTTWKQRVIELRKLAASGRRNLFKMVKLAVELFEDDEFRSEQQYVDDAYADGWLTSEFFSDYGLTFLELRATLHQFKTEAEWKDRPILKLYADVKAKADDDHPREQRHVARATLADLKERDAKIKDVESRNRYLDEQLQEIRQRSETEIDRLRRENSELREQLAMSNGRIQELERLLSREMAAA